MKKTHNHKGITYFASLREARKIQREYPGSRVVGYIRGYTVQYRVSGPYYPEQV